MPFLADGAQMAIDELNEAGGVGGQAVEEEPTAMLGLPSSGQVLAVAQRVGDAQIPMLYGATAPQALVGAEGSVANDYGFLMRPPQHEVSGALVRFAAEGLGVEKIGLVCVNNPFGDAGCGVAEETAEEIGATIVFTETVEQDATDFSGTVVELRSAGAEAVVSYVFPNAVGALHNALADNDLDVPHVSGSSSLIAFTGAITSGNFDNLQGIGVAVDKTAVYWTTDEQREAALEGVGVGGRRHNEQDESDRGSVHGGPRRIASSPPARSQSWIIWSRS